MSLRDRCLHFLRMLIATRSGALADDAVDDLVAFVVSENGREAGQPHLDSSLPLCLYFENETDREEFITAVMVAKPGMTMKRMP